MALQEIPRYSQEEKKSLRLKVCTNCIYSACNNNRANKCSISSLVCTRDNNKNIIDKTKNLSETCPMNYWEGTNATKFIEMAKPGCGCGK